MRRCGSWSWSWCYGCTTRIGARESDRDAGDAGIACIL